MDFIHYSAVKHGYVTRPIDWPYSTFQRCVEKGFIHLIGVGRVLMEWKLTMINSLRFICLHNLLG